MVEETQKDILVIGSGGLLGRTLLGELGRTFSAAGLSREELDITDQDRTLELCRKFSPKVIILTAAFTDVDGCEKDSAQAFAINTQGAVHVALGAKAIGAKLIFVSTDYVFDGKENRYYHELDHKLPLSVYGRSKAQAEDKIFDVMKECVVIRTSWIFGEAAKGFIQFVMSNLRQKKPLHIIADKLSCPTYAVDLSRAIVKIVSLIFKGSFDFKRSSVLHITNSGVCSWYDQAKFVVEYFKLQDVSLSPTKLSDFPFKALRPRYSQLANDRYRELTGETLRPWQDALGEFLRCQKI